MFMNTRFLSFNISPASVTSFNVIAVLLGVPIYKKIVIPIASRFTGTERGLSHLQRIGTGLLMSTLSMVSAAMVEMKRLEIARNSGLVNENVAVPMSILWQIPQHILVGFGEVFNQIGMLEYFYDQAPQSMRSISLALAFLTLSIGSYVTSFILTSVQWFTTNGGDKGWIPDNLNEGHLDRFFFLMAGLSALNLIVFVKYVYVSR
ncbi:hypothetical protein LUZ60_006087 [Juncus effusus]|nr:hypothetical protein LUZ60_006087 [Juncus effusus]